MICSLVFLCFSVLLTTCWPYLFLYVALLTYFPCLMLQIVLLSSSVLQYQVVYQTFCNTSTFSHLLCCIPKLFAKLLATHRSFHIFCVASLLCTTHFSACILFKHVVKLAVDLAVFHVIVLIISLMK